MTDTTTIFFYIVAFAPVILIPIIGYVVIRYYFRNSEKAVKKIKNYINPTKHGK